MGKPQGTIEVFAYGYIFGTQGWSTGLSIAPTLSTGSWSLNLFTQYMAAIRVYYDTWWTACKAFNAGVLDYRGLRGFYYADGSGRVSLSAGSATGPISGSGVSNLHPSYTSLVCSLRTEVPGRAGRGRGYLPYTSGTLVSGTLQAPLGDCNAIGNAYLALINSLNAYTSAPQLVTSQRVVVASMVRNEKNPVTSILVNSVPDTQHRREDKAIANAQFTGIPT